MKNKLTKKQQREQGEKRLLADELFLLAVGANGCHLYGAEETGLAGYMGIEVYSRYVKAVRTIYCVKTEDGDNRHLFEIHNLIEFDTIDGAADHLWEGGVRARGDKR